MFDTLQVALIKGGKATIIVKGKFAVIRIYDAFGSIEEQRVKKLPEAVYKKGVWNIFALAQFLESL